MLKIITLNERVVEETATRPDILHFFDQGNFIFVREKSENFEMGCLWQPYVKPRDFDTLNLRKMLPGGLG